MPPLSYNWAEMFWVVEALVEVEVYFAIIQKPMQVLSADQFLLLSILMVAVSVLEPTPPVVEAEVIAKDLLQRKHKVNFADR